MLVELGVVEQRYQAVLEVLNDGATVTDVARRYGAVRQTVQGWLRKYAAQGLAGLVDQSSKPQSCPHQMAPTVEARVVAMRREHPGWGPRTIRVAVAANGRLAVSGGFDQMVWVWDLTSGEQLHALAGHDACVNAVAVMADGRRAVSVSDDGTLRVWDLTSGDEIHSCAHPTPGERDSFARFSDGSFKVRAVTVSANGRLAISACGDRTVRVWDLTLGREVARWTMNRM